MAAHAVSDHDMRPGMLARPFAVKSGQIGNPNRKIAGMADKGIVRQPARSTLPTPIETGHMPPCLMKMGNGFQIFLENRSEEHTSELQSLMRISYAVFCLKKKKNRYDSMKNLNHSTNNKRK